MHNWRFLLLAPLASIRDPMPLGATELAPSQFQALCNDQDRLHRMSQIVLSLFEDEGYMMRDIRDMPSPWCEGIVLGFHVTAHALSCVPEKI